MEQLADGHLSSGKYQSNTMPIHPVHIVVLSNSKPRGGTMSADRWNIRKIVNKNEPSTADKGFFEHDDSGSDSYSSDELEVVMDDIIRDMRSNALHEVAAAAATPPRRVNRDDPITPAPGDKRSRRTAGGR